MAVGTMTATPWYGDWAVLTLSIKQHLLSLLASEGLGKHDLRAVFTSLVSPYAFQVEGFSWPFSRLYSRLPHRAVFHHPHSLTTHPVRSQTPKGRGADERVRSRAKRDRKKMNSRFIWKTQLKKKNELGLRDFIMLRRTFPDSTEKQTVVQSNPDFSASVRRVQRVQHHPFARHFRLVLASCGQNENIFLAHSSFCKSHAKLPRVFCAMPW